MTVGNNSGEGYVRGDIVGIVTATSGVGKGTGATIEIDGIGNKNALYLTNVQGAQFDNGNTLLHFNSGTFTAVSNSIQVTANSEVYDDLYSGNVIEVEQYNHGMHAGNNRLEISNVQPDTAPVVLNEAIGLDATSLILNDPQNIGTAATATFAEFEGKPASTGLVRYGLPYSFQWFTIS